MRFLLLFLLLSSALVAANAEYNARIDLSQILELAIKFVLLNIKNLDTISLGDIPITLPEEIKDIALGSVDLKDAKIYGLSTLDIDNISIGDINISTEIYSIKNVCLKIGINKLGFSSNYNADIGIIDEIPVYGDGVLNLAVSLKDLDLCLSIFMQEDFSQIYVEDLVLKLELRDSESYITGFWKDEDVSGFVSTVINILEKFVVMWLSYERDCVSCVLSPVVKYILNSILPGNDDNQLEIHCSCLEGKDSDDMVKNLLISYHHGNMISLLSNSNHEYLRKIISKLEYNILEILNNEGFNMNL